MFRASIFVSKRYFKKRKKNWKNSYEFWKIDKFIRNEKRIDCLIIYWTIVLFTNWLITFRYYYNAKQMFSTSLIWLIFFSNFRYIAKYWNSDRIKLLLGKCPFRASLITLWLLLSLNLLNYSGNILESILDDLTDQKDIKIPKTL